MPVDRTGLALVADDGTQTTGTVWNDQWQTDLLDAIDDAIAAAIASGLTQTTTSTGSVNNFALTTNAGLLRANNATALTLTGLTAGADGQPLLIVAIGAGTVVLNDQDAGSTATNRIVTGAGAALTLAAGTGWAALVYDATTGRWRVVGSSVVASTSPVVQTTTSTGTVNDFALTASAALLRCNNASLLTLTGLAAGIDGQQLDIVSVGAGQVDLTNQGAGSTAANRMINGVTGPLSLSPGTGRMRLRYDGTTARWRVLHHIQGAEITPAYNATDFTANNAMTWTVDSGDVITYSYIVDGKTMMLKFHIATSTVGGTPSSQLRVAVPAGFVAAKTVVTIALANDNATFNATWIEIDAGTSYVLCYKIPQGGNWAASTNNSGISGTIEFEVQ